MLRFGVTGSKPGMGSPGPVSDGKDSIDTKRQGSKACRGVWGKGEDER